MEKKFIELANKIECLNKQRKELQKELDDVMSTLGLGYVILSEDGIVWQIQEPSGTYIEYRKISYSRTRKEGETKGTLSKAEGDRLVSELKK